MIHTWTRPLTLLLACVILAPATATHAAPIARAVTWNPNFNAAQVYAKKQDKLILAYFSGSDWDEWGKKLEKEVLSSPSFVDWVTKNVIPFRADFASNKKQDLYKKQNEDLKTRYQVAVVPTFLLLDSDGEIVARATYEDLKLLPAEAIGQPVNAINFLDDLVKNRPSTEKLVTQPSLAATIDNAKAHKLPVLLLLTRLDPVKPPTPQHKEATKILESQRFTRWANVNVAFYHAQWPAPGDKSEDATGLNTLITRYKLGPTDAQFVMFVPEAEAIRGRVLAFSTQDMTPLMTRLQGFLPPIEYKGTDWLTDIRLARAITSQQPKRVMFLYFTDNSEFCQKFEQEILKTEEFTTWPYYAFVNVRLDYNKDPNRPKELEAQNAEQANLYAVRGYPYVVLVNPKGQKIGEAKYMKGGPKPFLAELKKVYDKDIERRIRVGEDGY